MKSADAGRNRIVVVVGVDLSPVSEHLLTNARELTRPAGQAEMHIVHVLHPESLRSRLTEPISTATDGPESPSTRAHLESSLWELRAVCARIFGGTGVNITLHTPIGDPAEQITRLATRVGADLIIVEAHDRPWLKRMFRRSVVARISRDAPCSVLTSRPKGVRPEPSRQPVPSQPHAMSS